MITDQNVKSFEIKEINSAPPRRFLCLKYKGCAVDIVTMIEQLTVTFSQHFAQVWITVVTSMS